MISSTGQSTESAGVNGRARTLTEEVALLLSDLVRDGIPFADMRRADSLELQYSSVPDGARPSADGAGPDAIDRLEGPIVARRVPPTPLASSRLRYFLDGSQRTIPVFRFGVVPVVATVASAAILSRDPAGNPSIAPGTLRLEHTFLVPRRAKEPRVQEALRRIDALGMAVIDPLENLSEHDYDAVAGNYGRMIEFAYDRARNVRQKLEERLLGTWLRDAARATDDGWTVVDGVLRLAAPRAIGLVKTFTQQHLDGRDAAALLSLPPGHRTTAYHKERDWHEARLVDDTTSETPADLRTMWYLRFWDAHGLDARHALVRVEAPPDVRDTAQIDELSGWLLAERTPRATADARWATLLYPVHYLEQILKRRVDADTRGWPAAR